MAATLSSLIGRVRDLLSDSGGELWIEATLTEALRMALGEYNLAAQASLPGAAPALIESLDGAQATSLPAAHETPLAWGAAGYAAQARAVNRAGLHDDGTESKLLRAWGDARLVEFRTWLAALFPAGQAAEAARLAELRTTPNPPWATWPLDEDGQ